MGEHDELMDLDATAQAGLVRAGQVSALELVDAAIARIEARNPVLNAVSTTAFEAARTRAQGPLQGPLAGVPFLVKELIAYPGVRQAMGSRLFASNVAHAPSPYASCLDAAGLVVLGATTTSEFGLLGSTETLLDGVTKNPVDSTRSAGGSSGGSAAAVAGGLVPMAHASDGGGSIRIPAAMNGLFGFKPGRRRIVPGGPDDMNGMLCEHCVSRSVRDSALLFSLTERGDQPRIGHITGPSTTRLRIGWYRQTLLGEEPSEAASVALASAVELCAGLGHDVVETTPPVVDGRAVSDGFFTLAGFSVEQIAQMMEPMLGGPVGPHVLEPFTLELLEWFRGLPDDAITVASEGLARAGAAMQAFLDGFDVVLCPTTPIVPWALGTLAPTVGRAELIRRTETLAGYTPIHNIAGVPAMTLPLTRSERGLPLGTMFAAAQGREAMLFELAYELEAAQPWVR